MPAAYGRRRRRTTDIWPGFVDALATLLMVIIFVLMIFVLSQFVLSHALSGRDEALRRMQTELAEIADLLALERGDNERMRANVSRLSEELRASVRKRDDLSAQVLMLTGENERLTKDLGAAFETMQAEREKVALQLEQLAALQSRLDELTARALDLETERDARAEALARAQAELETASETIATGTETIEAKLTEIAALNAQIDALEALKEQMEERLVAADASLAEEKELSETALAQAALMRRQVEALREQIAALNETLEASEAKNAEQNVQIADLGKRLNAALATKVQELARYRSEFFGRLREILGDQRDVRIVGDRFVLQSEVLFDVGSADLGERGRAKLAELARSLREISAKIPEDIDWILRVDGHTDKTPISNWQYPSNWHLSAARAISVVRFLVREGIPADHLAATGFADRHPLDARKDEIAYRRNRRIELKLTQR